MHLHLRPCIPLLLLLLLFSALPSALSTPGLSIDTATCPPSTLPVLHRAIAAAQAYISAALVAAAHPSSDPYLYFFRASASPTVLSVLARMNATLHNDATAPVDIRLTCADSHTSRDKDWSCTGPSSTLTGDGAGGVDIFAWSVTDEGPGNHSINLCPLTLNTIPAGPDRCQMPSDPSPHFVSATEHWPRSLERWLDSTLFLADFVVHELSHFPEVRRGEGMLAGTQDSYHYAQFASAWGAHAVAHAEDVVLMVQGPQGRQQQQQQQQRVWDVDLPTNWEYFAKESWRRGVVRGEEGWRRECAARKKGGGGNGERDELRRRRRRRRLMGDILGTVVAKRLDGSG